MLEFESVTIQKKAIEASSFLCYCLKCCGCDHPNQVIEQYFPVIDRTVYNLYKAVLTFGSVDKILKCDHSNESY